MTRSFIMIARIIISRLNRKTAYEIIAGDWSSDVCSSDLACWYNCFLSGATSDKYSALNCNSLSLIHISKLHSLQFLLCISVLHAFLKIFFVLSPSWIPQYLYILFVLLLSLIHIFSIININSIYAIHIATICQ